MRLFLAKGDIVMKKITALLMAILLSFGVAACGSADGPTNNSNTESDTTSNDDFALQSPSNLYYDEDSNMLEWGIVDNASGYRVMVDAKERETDNNYFDVSTLNLSAGTHTAKVKTVGSAPYRSSEYGEEITFSIKNTETEEGIKLSHTYRVKSAEKENDQFPSYSIKDSRYYYYVWYIGEVANVPLQSAEDVADNTIGYWGAPFSYTFESSYSQTDSISDTVSSATEKCTSKSGSANVSVSDSSTIKVSSEGNSGFLKAGLEYENTFELALAYAREWGTTNAQTTSNSYETASSYTYTQTTTISISFDDRYSQGWYRYILFGNMDVFTAIIYDTETDTVYSWNTSKITSVIGYSFEYTPREDGQFGKDTYDKLDFDAIDVDDLIQNHAPTTSVQDLGEDNPFVVRFKVLFDQNGGYGGSDSTEMSYEKWQLGKKPTAPIRDGYIFTGYYDDSKVGSGTKYYDADMNISNQVIENEKQLYAHWVKDSQTVEVNGANNSVAINSLNQSNKMEWKQYSNMFRPSYTAQELAELKDCGYTDLMMEISIKIKDDGMTYQGLALQRFVTSESTTTPNSTLASAMFFVVNDADYSAGGYMTRKLYYSADISMCASQYNSFRLAYGLRGNASYNPSWNLGEVVATFTPSKTTTSTYASGGWYALNVV